MPGIMLTDFSYIMCYCKCVCLRSQPTYKHALYTSIWSTHTGEKLWEFIQWKKTFFKPHLLIAETPYLFKLRHPFEMKHPHIFGRKWIWYFLPRWHLLIINFQCLVRKLLSDRNVLERLMSRTQIFCQNAKNWNSLAYLGE